MIRPCNVYHLFYYPSSGGTRAFVTGRLKCHPVASRLTCFEIIPQGSDGCPPRSPGSIPGWECHEGFPVD